MRQHCIFNHLAFNVISEHEIFVGYGRLIGKANANTPIVYIFYLYVVRRRIDILDRHTCVKLDFKGYIVPGTHPFRNSRLRNIAQFGGGGIVNV